MKYNFVIFMNMIHLVYGTIFDQPDIPELKKGGSHSSLGQEYIKPYS
jgi:hypothetical protein